MIRRVVEYVAADRELAWAWITDPDNGADETSVWSRANERAEDAVTAVQGRRGSAVAYRLAEQINKRLWQRGQDLDDTTADTNADAAR